MPTATTRPNPTRTASHDQISSTDGTGATSRKSAKGRRQPYGRIRREGDEEIVREAQSDYGGSDLDDEDSFSESSVVSMPESALQSTSNSQPTPEQTNLNVSIVSEPGTSSGNRLLSALQESRIDWSDAVFKEEGEVPVLDFEKMESLDQISSTNVEGAEESDTGTSSKMRQAGAGQGLRRPVGMTARQVYLKRLENDPAYTPRVGEFWGHDERLLDKDLRSLSGWWRGKWTGRGGFQDQRGRGGFARHMRGNASESWGVGGFVGANKDPVEMTWKHDGFEEMEKKQEPTEKEKVNPNNEESQRAGTSVARGRGRGGFGRGFAPAARVNRSQSFAQPSSPLVRTLGHMRGNSTHWHRAEQPWTKHATSFLFQDTLNKPRENGDIGVRVKLPGQARYNVLRVSKKEDDKAGPSEPSPARAFVVKIPKTKNGNDQGASRVNSSAHVPKDDTPLVAEAVTSTNGISPPTPPPSNDPSLEAPASLEPAPSQGSAINPSEQVSTEDAPADPQPRVLPNVQLITNFPAPTPSPAYSSPSYGSGYQVSVPRPPAYPANAEPPIWFDPRMPYGYPTPPPIPHANMYTPPPPIHHVHHHHSHSLSHQGMVRPPSGTTYFAPPMQEFHPPPMVEYAQHPSQARPDMHRSQSSFTYAADGAMIDIQTGTPIFSMPKGTKVAIKKPGERDEATSQHQRNKSTSSNAGIATANGTIAEESTVRDNVAQRPVNTLPPPVEYRPGPDMQTPVQPYMQGGMQGQPFWGGYPQPPQGYYYPSRQYPVPPPQEYGYPHPMAQGVPVPGYVQTPYGEEYQHPVYY